MSVEKWIVKMKDLIYAISYCVLKDLFYILYNALERSSN